MTKRYNSCVDGVPNREKRENVTKEIFEEILDVHFFKLMKDTKLETGKVLLMENNNFQTHPCTTAEMQRPKKILKQPQ